MPELRKDPVVGRWVIISTDRARRPSDFGPEPVRPHGGNCVFCPGSEDKTPKEVLAGQSRPGQNWGKSPPEEQARVRENLHRLKKLTPEQRQRLRERWQNATPEERQRMLERRRQRMQRQGRPPPQ